MFKLLLVVAAAAILAGCVGLSTDSVSSIRQTPMNETVEGPP